MKFVIILCEGYDDIVFIERSLGANAQCERIKKTIGELPAPFGPQKETIQKGLVYNSLVRRDFLTENLTETNKSIVPSFERFLENKKANTTYVIMQMRGKALNDKVLGFLNYLPLAFGAREGKQLGSYRISEGYAVALVCDADSDVNDTIKKYQEDIKKHFKIKIEDEFIHGKWSKIEEMPFGIFVFHSDLENNNNDQTGTLENATFPLLQQAWKNRINVTESFIDENTQNDDEISIEKLLTKEGLSPKEKEERLLAIKVKRLKAIITAAGQFKNPGSSLSGMFHRDFISKKFFQESKVSVALAEFLTSETIFS